MAFHQSSKISIYQLRVLITQLIPVVGLISNGPFKPSEVVNNFEHMVLITRQIPALGIISAGPFKSSIKTCTDIQFETKGQ